MEFILPILQINVKYVEFISYVLFDSSVLFITYLFKSAYDVQVIES